MLFHLLGAHSDLVVKPRPGPLLWDVVASFAFVLADYASLCSATLWIYSTLLLQLLVPNDILGRGGDRPAQVCPAWHRIDVDM